MCSISCMGVGLGANDLSMSQLPLLVAAASRPTPRRFRDFFRESCLVGAKLCVGCFDKRGYFFLIGMKGSADGEPKSKLEELVTWGSRNFFFCFVIAPELPIDTWNLPYRQKA